VVHSGVHHTEPEKSLGYLATMLIRKSPRKHHAGDQP
jgi:hypothetical protein